jgi:(p)ppGpp synthase/HD superfamily hydrolase
MLDRAIIFAAEAHKGQKRKYTDLPYIIHPIEVMTIVASVDHDENMLVAAVLHDVVEDTPICLGEIMHVFGVGVRNLVAALTDQCTEGNRATRKVAEAQRWARQSPDAQTIKLADLISNTKSIVKHDPKFAKVYLAEKEALLWSLTEGDVRLRMRAQNQVETALRQLELVA